MSRSLVILASCFLAFQCITVSAQGHHRRSHSWSSSRGFNTAIGTYPGYGYRGFGFADPYRFDGYGYDPYRYGNFQAPDLLNDPYFQARHRHESRFPGRRSAPLVLRTPAPVATYHSQRGKPTSTPDRTNTPSDLVGPSNSLYQP